MFRTMRPDRLKVLMLSSYSLLIVCSALWLKTQYTNGQLQLGRDLAKLFDSVQEQISDSLVMAHVVLPALEEQGKPARPAVGPMPQEIRLLLQQVTGLSSLRQEELMHMDTVLFNRIFQQRMQENGWHFNSRWIASKDSNEQERGAQVFLNSRFFSNKKGVVVARIDGYLLRSVLPQCCFIIIMLSVTGIAFRTLYRSLRNQIQLGKLKDDFVSNMSHELKTPVATVKLALEAMTDDQVLADRDLHARYLHMAVKEAERLELLMTHTLNTSMMKSGHLLLRTEACDLSQLLNEVVTAFRLKLPSGKISMEVSGRHFRTMVDRLHTQGVLLNILDNSLKYAGETAEIRISLEETKGQIRLSIADNGPGIPDQYRHKVFEQFFRVPAEPGRPAVKGYGLGLSYAAQVMRQQYGRIQVANRPGGGCAFTLSF